MGSWFYDQRPMEYGLQVSGTYDHLLDASRFAAEHGLCAIALPDHYLMARTEDEARTVPAPDAFVQFGALARDTEDLELVMLVSPITFRHPAVIGKMAITIDNLSDGRFALGVGTGWLDREHEVFGFPYPPMTERFEALEEALGYLTAMFDPDTPGFNGTRYSLEGFPIAPAPKRRIPLVIGGTGKHKTPRLAGEYADEFNVYPGADMGDRIERCREAALDAGRDPEAIRISSSGQVVGTETEADFEARMDDMASQAGITREELEAHYERRQTPRGTYEQVRAQLDRFASLGVTRFYFQGGFSPDETGALLDGLGIE